MAMEKELAGLNKAGTFTKIECMLEGRKAVSATWVFSHKTNEKGLITDLTSRPVWSRVVSPDSGGRLPPLILTMSICDVI